MIPFETPTDGKNAVVTRSRSTSAASALPRRRSARAAGEPVVVIGAHLQPRHGRGREAAKSGINSIKDLQGQEGRRSGRARRRRSFILERLRHGRHDACKDIQPVRVSFSEMHAGARARRHRRLCRCRARPRSISVVQAASASSSNTRTRTPMGSAEHGLRPRIANMIAENPELVRASSSAIHRRATEYTMANPGAMVDDGGGRSSGSTRRAIELSVAAMSNCTWKLDADGDDPQSKIYAEHMLALKQIRQLPDFATFHRHALRRRRREARMSMTADMPATATPPRRVGGLAASQRCRSAVSRRAVIWWRWRFRSSCWSLVALRR